MGERLELPQIGKPAGRGSASSDPFANAHHLSARSRETDGTHPIDEAITVGRSGPPVANAYHFLSRARARTRGSDTPGYPPPLR